MLPTFLVVGAMKAGTDSLWQYLRSHPQVFMSEKKELDFFTTELNWRRGSSWYGRQFAGAGEAVALGEASTSYTKHPLYRGVPGRIAGLLPDVRFVYLVRDPVERMRSQYLHEVLLGVERAPVEHALLENPRYLDFSMYATQIERYLEHFPLERMLIVASEDLRDRRAATMRRVFEFIGVGASWGPPDLDEEHHRTASKRVLRGPFDVIHRLPGYRALTRLVPAGVKEATLGIRTHGVDPDRATITDDLERRLRDRLTDEVARLRTYMGNGFGGWGIA